jgi:hypothetical protein
MSSKKDIIDKISSFEGRIREHEEKLRRDSDSYSASHWKSEISEWQSQVSKLREMLNDGGYEEYCPHCHKDVYVRNNKCPKCETYLG